MFSRSAGLAVVAVASAAESPRLMALLLGSKAFRSWLSTFWLQEIP